jgi:hypothetical protein
MNPYTINEVQFEIDEINAGHRLGLPEVEGYSGWKVRNLLHRLNKMRKHTKYLEIGVHLGSTFIPAVYGNSTIRATAIDAWNMFGDLEDRFKHNVYDHISPKKVNIVHADFRTLDVSCIWGPVNVYFYDGDHGSDCQYKAITHVYPALADQFILIVDDFNWQEPRDETYRALRDLHAQIECEWVLKGPYNGNENEWWNSLFVGIIRKANT